MLINGAATLRLGYFLRDELRSMVVQPLQRDYVVPGNGSDYGGGCDEGLAEAVEAAVMQTIRAFCDDETSAHALRLACIVEAVGISLHLTWEEIFRLRMAALLHDIGKVAIPSAVLLKPGALDIRERDIIRQHVFIGQQMLYVAGDVFAAFAPIVAAHHEAWNGHGYPLGLAGEDIPFLARILAVVDAYDAMVSSRVYGEPQPILNVCRELIQCAGHQFDPQIVLAFLRVLNDQQTRYTCFLPFKQIPSTGELVQVDEAFSMLSLQFAEYVHA
jgi:HD-GYP domain-containing protein (c-di-GMP phosphodiesterase class II)